ncbi:hypothetical protein [Mesorhizobium sp.]|jgi:hypothetical protein|uniref:hypothetical protein n=1 Tax=Mesorhizobium sp. TaxID=1871066 RepID=UPI0035648980
MFFTKFGLVIAWLLLTVGTFRVGTAFYIAYTMQTNMAPRYLGSKTTGEVIDAGLLYILIGVALGVLVEISRSLVPKQPTI